MKESRRAFLASLGALAACGGGSGSAPAPTPAPPPPPPAQRLLRMLPPYAGSTAVLWGVSEDRKLCKSTDGGESWASLLGPAVEQIDNVFAAGADTLWLTGQDAGQPVLWRGTAAGSGWVKRSLPVGTPVGFGISSDDGQALAVTWITSFGGMSSFRSRFLSADGGASWVTAPDVFGETLSTGVRWSSEKALRGTNYGLLPYGAVRRSTNSGQTWDVRLPLDDSRAGTLIGSPDPSALLVASYAHKGSMGVPEAPVDWRLHLTQDGGLTWTEWDAPASVQTASAIHGASPLGGLIATRLGDTQLLRSADYGRTWQPLVLPMGATDVTALGQGALWVRVGTAAQASTDLGNTWMPASWPAGVDPLTTPLRQTGPSRLLAQVANAGGVWLSTDLGKTWQEIKVS